MRKTVCHFRTAAAGSIELLLKQNCQGCLLCICVDKTAAGFPKLINLAIQSYLKKAQYPMFYNKLIGEVMVKLNGGFPDHFSLKEQGEFIVGYYQQNQAFYEKKNQEDREDERYGTGK